jgi:hypothetical protein
MDDSNLKLLTKRLGLRVSDLSYLPVPVMNVEKYIRGYKANGSVVITYLGRGNEKLKVYPVVRLLKDLNAMEDLNMELSIITDTNFMFEEFIASLVPENRIKVSYVNGLCRNELESYLKVNSDIHFAMGTSALEAAKLGIPTIIVDGSHKEMPDSYRYKWNFQMENYSLGDEVTNVDTFTGMTMEEVWQVFSSESVYDDISSKCLEYTRKNHSIEAFVDILKEACSKTTLTADVYCGTRFSKNMLYIAPVIRKLSELKHRVTDRLKAV